MAFRIEISDLAESELKAIRVFERRTIVDHLMKEATLEQFVQDPHAFVRASQQERVLVTHNGQPLAMVVGVEHKGAEDWQLEASPDFWRMIDERHQRPTRPLDAAETDLFAEG